ncbi:MAG: DUF3304 domain-containing protein [Burkholderiales bacterium]|nr:DUF3304 domain-containing protein [Burkholderiales bacterium]MCA3166813.1 DUF3304 domain-containing protein [Burkholderiales bacterium]MCA3172893.1 DUF3304 domain-containing protein [Burkholderiales bacterium]
MTPYFNLGSALNQFRGLCLLLALPLLLSCSAKPVTLSLIAYNYTGRYIDSYAVDGQGGGNAYETTAGGRVVCCLSFRPDSKLPFTVKVDWVFGREEDAQRRVTRPQEKRSAIATVYGPIPERPSSFETHFLPNGEVFVQITGYAQPSDPYFTPQGVPLRPLPAPGVAP